MGEASQIPASRKALAAAASAAVVLALVAVTHRSGDDAGAPDSRDVAMPDATVPDAPAAQAAAPAGKPVAGDTATPGERPGFDVVRVAPDGAAVVAGHATPGARVSIRADETLLAETEADGDGNFVALFQADGSGSPRALTLSSEAPDGTRLASDEAVVLLPGTSERDGAAGAEGEGEGAAAGFEPASGTAAQDEVAATAVVRPEAVEVALAGPPDPTVRQVSLASISYAEQGQVTLAGAGTAGARVRAYVDDDLAREAAVGPDGQWSLDLGDVARGLYRLRIDQLDPDGRVASRVETPFQRDFPTAPLPRPGGGPGLSITVQPGSNLWTIARVHYGSGVLYTQIFTANRDLIRDPDLIYPGQVLALPGREEAD